MKRVGIIADRIGWEERRLIDSPDRDSIVFEWLNDESLCLGGPALDQLSERFDAVLIRSRSYTRGGLIAALTEAAGICTLNSASAVSLCENKLLLRSKLKEAGIPVTDYRLVLARKDFEKAVQEVGLPAVLKPVFGGMGKRVALLREPDTAHSTYDYIEDLAHGFEQASLLEPYLADGASIRCFVAGREVVATAEFRSAGTDWRSNAALGNQRARIPRSDVVDTLVDRIIDVIGEGVYGIDLFRTDAGYVVNEVNHAPAFRAVEDAAGVDVAARVLRYVEGRVA